MYSALCSRLSSKRVHFMKYLPLTSRLLPTFNPVIKQQRYLKKLSYSHCPDARPIVSATVCDFIDWNIKKYADRELVVDCSRGIRKTFGQFLDDVHQFTAGLISLNFNVGDRIGIWSTNRYEWLVAQFAISKAGLIMVPINWAYQVPEVRYCLEKMEMRGIIAERQFKTQNYYQMMNEIIPEIQSTKANNKIISKSYPYFDTLILMTDDELPGTFTFGDVNKRAGSEHFKQQIDIQNSLDPHSAAYILFTSGTSGKPKGATISHQAVINTCMLGSHRDGTDKESFRILCSLPLFHALGCLLIAIEVFASGGCIVLPNPGYNPTESLRAIEKEKCSMLYGTPTMYFDLLSHPNLPKTDVSSIKHAKVGGSFCPPTLINEMREKLKCTTIVGYGMTELSGLVTMSPHDAPPEHALQSAGTAMEHLEIKIVDGNGNMVPQGVAGEIYIRGYRVMMGYWNDEEKTRKTISSDGWYRSGDVGIMLENGTLQIVDRMTELVIRGGANIYPKEVENILTEHPKVLEVAVIGVPDDRLGEELCAWIRCKPQETLSESEIKTFCKGKITHYKIPKYVRFVDDFPKTQSGKIQKTAMREEEAKRNRG